MAVWERFRSLSGKKFFILAQDIRAETQRVMQLERVVPKSYRFTSAVPVIDLARSMVRNIERSDAFYPNSTWAVIKRKEYLALAIADANAICDELWALIRLRGGPKKEPDGVVCPVTGRYCHPSPVPGTNPKDERDEQDNGGKNGIDVNEFLTLLEMLNEEIDLLTGAKNGVRLLGKESEEDRLRAAEDEARRLRDIISMRDDEKRG